MNELKVHIESENIYVEEQAPEPWTVREPIYDKELPKPDDTDSELGRIRMTSGMVPSPLMRLKSPSSDASSRCESENERISPLPMLETSIKSGKKPCSIYSANDGAVMRTLSASPLGSADLADVESNVSMNQFENSNDLDEGIKDINENLRSLGILHVYANIAQAKDYLDSESVVSQVYSDSKRVQNSDSSQIDTTLREEYHPIPLGNDLYVPKSKTNVNNYADGVYPTNTNNDIAGHETLHSIANNTENQGTKHPIVISTADHDILRPIATHPCLKTMTEVILSSTPIKRQITPDLETTNEMLLKSGLVSESRQQNVNNTSDFVEESDKDSSVSENTNDMSDDKNSAGINESSKSRIIDHGTGTEDLKAIAVTHTKGPDVVQTDDSMSKKVGDTQFVNNPESIASTSNTATSNDSDIEKHVSFNVADETPATNDHIASFLASIPSVKVQEPSKSTFSDILERLSGSEDKLQKIDEIKLEFSVVMNESDKDEPKFTSHSSDIADKKDVELITRTPEAEKIATESSSITENTVDNLNSSEIVGEIEPWAASVKEKIIAIESLNAAKADFETVEALRAKVESSKLALSNSDTVMKEDSLETVPDTSNPKSISDTVNAVLDGAAIVGGIAAASVVINGKAAKSAAGLQSQEIHAGSDFESVDDENKLLKQDFEANLLNQDVEGMKMNYDDKVNEANLERGSEGSEEPVSESIPSNKSGEAIPDNLPSEKVNESDPETVSEDSDDQIVLEKTSKPDLNTELEPPVPVEATTLFDTIISTEIPELSGHLKFLGLDSDAVIKELSSNPNLRNDPDGDEAAGVNSLVEDSVNFLMFNSNELMKVKTREEALCQLSSLRNYDETILKEATADQLPTSLDDQNKIRTAKTRNADDLLKQLAHLIRELNEEIVGLADENNEQRIKIKELERKTQ